MSTSKSAARISVVHKDNDADVKNVNTHQRLLFVGEGSLQMKMLMSLLSGKFGLPASIIEMDKLSSKELSSISDTLVILDCLSLEQQSILTLLKTLDSERKPGTVLINIQNKAEYEALGEWSQVVGMIHTNVEPELVLAGFDQILKGGLWLPRKVMENMIRRNGRLQGARQNKLPPLPVKLTRRENQILEKLAEGRSNTKIADSLFLSEHTVKTHLYNIYKKVNVSSRTQACNWLKQYQDD